MVHDNMNISHLIVHSHHVEQTRLRKNNREAKRVKSYDCGASKGMLEIQDNPRLNKRFSNQFPFKFTKAHYDKLSNPMSLNGRNTSSQTNKPTCGMSGKKYYGKCDCQLLWMWKEWPQG